MPFSSFDIANLRQRTISAVVLMPVVLAAVYFGGYVFALMVIVMAAICMHEWMHMVTPEAGDYVKWLAIALVVVVLVFAQAISFVLGIVCAILATLLLFMVVSRARLGNAALICTGIPYIALCSLAMLYVRNSEGFGRVAAFYLLTSVWSMDIGAFLVGRMVGGPKLMPLVSPNKTWAGLIGGAVLAAISAGMLITATYPHHVASLVFLAVLLALVAQVGDLFESYIKRISGVKDSGSIIPGHGGVLDRVDGLLFAAAFHAVMIVMVGLG